MVGLFVQCLAADVCSKHCGKPICCPVASAPKGCKWRGDNSGGGASTDCSAQCFPGEVNVAGIKSSWGGGFTNDGDTNKCGRGKKSFCCPDSDAGQVTKGCKYAPWSVNALPQCSHGLSALTKLDTNAYYSGKSCPSGTTSVIRKTDTCSRGTQQYCCPYPVQLEKCHWVQGSGGDDCANAICDSTELEIDRAQFGDTFDYRDGEGGCDCKQHFQMFHHLHTYADRNTRA